jgi:DNA-binding MarR family transcriptional regulator
MAVDRALSLALHTLTARLDRTADRILRAEQGLSYRRFLVLFMVDLIGTPTQRALAEHLGVTEPSVSRMTSALARTGLLEARPDPVGGNRRQLHLTANGRELVRRCRQLLEARLAALVEASGVPYDLYTRYTNQLLATLDSGENVDRPSHHRTRPPLLPDRHQAAT